MQVSMLNTACWLMLLNSGCELYKLVNGAKL